jgi:hypothetical protein
MSGMQQQTTNQWVIQNVVDHFYFKKSSASQQAAFFSVCNKQGKLALEKKKQLWKMLQITSQLTSIIMAVTVTVEVVVILQMWNHISLISFLYSAGNGANVFGIQHSTELLHPHIISDVS